MKKPKNCPKVTVLICTLNEEGNLPNVLSKIPVWVDEIILIDGHSTDGTVGVAKKLCSRINVLLQPGKGKGDALKFGVRQATGDIIVTLDSDGQTDPEDIPRFIEPLLNGHDFAKGTRLLYGRPPNMSRRRWAGNKILAVTSNLLSGTKYSDVCSGFNAFWKRAFLCLKLTYDSFEMEQEMLVRAKKAGLKVIEVAHQDRGRSTGVSKVNDVKQGFTDLLVIIKACLHG